MADDIQKLIDALESWGAEPKTVLADTFMNDMDFYKDCLEKFSEDTLLQTLWDSLVSGKMEAAIRAVHTMKGNADYLGLFPVLDAAMIVLMDLRANNLTQAIANMPNLEAVFAEFQNIWKLYLELDSEKTK